MNRVIWIWRFIALVIMIIFAVLMWNLYARLTGLSRQQGQPAAASAPAESGGQETTGEEP